MIQDTNIYPPSPRSTDEDLDPIFGKPDVVRKSEDIVERGVIVGKRETIIRTYRKPQIAGSPPTLGINVDDTTKTEDRVG